MTVQPHESVSEPMTNPTLERWKTGCDHVWMQQPLQAARCAKCGISRVFAETKSHQSTREWWRAS